MSWDELWTDFVLWLRLSPIALVAFVVWLCLPRLTARAEDRAARVRYERAQPRFDARRNDIL